MFAIRGGASLGRLEGGGGREGADSTCVLWGRGHTVGGICLEADEDEDKLVAMVLVVTEVIGLSILSLRRGALPGELDEEEDESFEMDGGVAIGLGSGVLIGMVIPDALHSRINIFCW